MEKALARYHYQRRNFKRILRNFEVSLMEKEDWNNVLLQAIQLNDNQIRSYILHIENLREISISKYELGKSLAESQYQKKLDEAELVIAQVLALRKLTKKLKKEKKALSESIKQRTQTIMNQKKYAEELEEDKKTLEDFNNQLCDQYKGQESQINDLQQRVKDLSDSNNSLTIRNNNLSKEIKTYETRLNKLTRNTTALSKRIDYSEAKSSKIEEKVNLVTQPPKGKKQKKKPKV